MADGLPHWIDRDMEARKHLWKGLERLGPERRITFLQSLVNRGGHSVVEVRVTSHTGTTHESYLDVMMLCANHGVSLQTSCAELERWLRRL